MTRRDYKCPHCGHISEIETSMVETPHVHCEQCGALMRRYFGAIWDVPVNYGFRPARYLNKDDERIAQYQFENL